jgi:acyl carrier protein
MGLDAVEIVLRTEELFGITLREDEGAAVRTVGDLYKLVCSKLNVSPLPSPVSSAKLPTITHKQKTFLFLYTHTPLPAPPEVLPWSPQSVWDCVVAVVVDQQGVRPQMVTHSSLFIEDLGLG